MHKEFLSVSSGMSSSLFPVREHVLHLLFYIFFLAKAFLLKVSYLILVNIVIFHRIHLCVPL